MHYTEEGSYRDIRAFLERKPAPQLPTAFVCDDDTIAVGAIRAFSERGIQIPDDISIIGFNDRPSCEVTDPPLTSINVSKHAMAKETVDELIHLLQNRQNVTPENRSRKIRIGTKLLVRQSVAMARGHR